MQPPKEMPIYQSHKRVRALKISGMNVHEDGEVLLAFADKSFEPQRIKDFAKKLPTDMDYDDPGYLVVYEDGYQSWSPTKAFEEGYSPLAIQN